MSRLSHWGRAALVSLRRGLLPAMVAGLVASAMPARASVTLADFINTPLTITQDDKNFTGQPGSLTVVATGNPTAVPPIPAPAFSASNVSVSGISDATLGPGLQYQSAQFSVSAGQTLDVHFAYSVAVTPGSGALIHDASMTILSGAISGDGSIVITESAFADAAHTIPVADVLVVKNPTLNQPFDQVFFSPVSTVYIEKDIALSGGTSGFANFSVMNQNFSETSVVPEPGTIALALSGLPVLGLYLVRRRRSRA